MAEHLLTIGVAAKRTGISVQAVRYYERRGLVLPGARRDSGYRLYGEDAVRRIRFIRNAQSLGFSLDEIRSLLELRVSRRSQCARVARRAEEKLLAVRFRLESLRAMEASLSALIRACRASEATARCPILSGLELEPARKGGRS